MTTIFSWMLTSHHRQVRFVLASDVLIQMARGWDDEQWMVLSTTLHSGVKSARRSAFGRTDDLADDGFTLVGPVAMVTADIEPGDLYMENAAHDSLGPLLVGLFALTWTDLP